MSEHGTLRCGFCWLLLDPNEEDQRSGTTHVCRLYPGHENDYRHQCTCGARASIQAIQVGWRSPARADGVADGKWWYYDLDEEHPDDAQPVYGGDS